MRPIELDTRGELEYRLLATIAEVGPYAGAVAIHLGSVESPDRDNG